jgi:hypothetical protein
LVGVFGVGLGQEVTINVAAPEEVDAQAFETLLVTIEACEEGVQEDIFSGKAINNEDMEVTKIGEGTLGEESGGRFDALQLQHCKVMVRILWISPLSDFQHQELKEDNPGRRAREDVHVAPINGQGSKIGHALNNIFVDLKVEKFDKPD